MRIHINLSVKDLDRSIDYYTRLFGVGPSKIRSDYANWQLLLNGSIEAQLGTIDYLQMKWDQAYERLGKGQRIAEVVLTDELPRSTIGKVLTCSRPPQWCNVCFWWI